MKRWKRVAPAAAMLMAGIVALAGCGGYGYYGGVYVRTPPPPLRYEVYGPAPGPGYVWINGYWSYRGNAYVWTPGRWERPPRGKHHWEDGRWERHGDGYRWREGRWR
jgi:hypothetical protein